MNQTDNSIFGKSISPYQQATLVLAADFGILIIAKLAEAIGITSLDEAFPWTLAAALLLFFAIFNSVFSLSAKDDNSYWSKSFIAFGCFVVLSAMVAYIVAGLSMEEIVTYKWIYIVITFVYFVFISIIGFMKRIVEFAQREEWAKPMRRSKKR